jgi:1-acyl-sn-glycerol-3-phosphate acyltransferase
MLYWIIRKILKIYFFIILDVLIQGLENIPEDDRAILLANHPSTLDTFLIMSIIKRKIYTFGNANFFNKPLNRRFLRALGGIPVKNDKFNRSSLIEAEQLLHQKNLILIFPEGRVNPGNSLLPLRNSFIKISTKLRTPIVPIVISGSDNSLKLGRFFPRPSKIFIKIFKPVQLSIPKRQKANIHLQKVRQNIRNIFINEINTMKILQEAK